ncbi:MAG: dephospho-CoA kinase [Burkholderiaceae bacterium]|nr:dephospho-CoA kinase [Burkholderiaceae bacterium]
MNKPAKRFSVGLTGGIGSGKTTVANLFGELGAAIIDTDLIAHQVTAPGGRAIAAIKAEFGADFLTPDGAMDRARMRELVFSDAAQKARLETILHPLIREETEAEAARVTGIYIMFVVPLLVESKTWAQRVDRILVIDCPEEIQLARVMQRNGLAESQVRAIMAAQVPRAVRIAAADDVLDNAGEPGTLSAQVERLHALYCALAA